MKKILFLTLFLLFLSNNFAMATGAGYRYTNGGLLFSRVTMPLSLPNAKYVQENNMFPSSKQAIEDNIDIKNLKVSKSCTTRVMGVIELGNAGIYRTAKKGNINSIYYVDYTNEKLWIPVFIIPICYRRYITTVYGE